MTNNEVVVEDCIRVLIDALCTHEKELFYESRKRELGLDWVTRRKRCAVLIPRYISLSQEAVDSVILKLVHAGWVSEWIDVNDRSSHSHPGFLCWLDPHRSYYLAYPVEGEDGELIGSEIVGIDSLDKLLVINPATFRPRTYKSLVPVITLKNDYSQALYRWDTDRNLWHMVIPSVRLLP